MKIIFLILVSLSITSCVPGSKQGDTNTSSGIVIADEEQILVPSGGVGESIAKDSLFQTCAREAIRGCGSQAIVNYANSGNSLKVCDGFSDATLKNECVRAITQAKAVQSNDVESCNAIVDPTDQYSCKRQVIFNSALSTANPKKCNQLKEIKPPDAAALTFLPGNVVDQCMLPAILAIQDTVAATDACSLMSESGVISLCNKQIKDRPTTDK